MQSSTFTCLITILAVANAASISLDASTGVDAGDCTTTPCFTLCYALTQIDNTTDNTITLAAGMYDYSSDAARCTSQNLNNHTVIAGAGSETTVLDYGNSTMFNESSVAALFLADTSDASLSLSGLKFKNIVTSNSTSAGSVSIHGALSVSDFALENVVNVVEGFYFASSTVTVSGVTVVNGQSAARVLDFTTDEGAATLEDITASESPTMTGDAFMQVNSASDVTLSNVRFTGMSSGINVNTASANGSLTIDDVVVSGWDANTIVIDAADSTWDSISVTDVTVSDCNQFRYALYLGGAGSISDVTVENVLDSDGAVVWNVKGDLLQHITSTITRLTVRNVTADETATAIELNGTDDPNMIISSSVFQDLVLIDASAPVLYSSSMWDVTFKTSTINNIHSTGEFADGGLFGGDLRTFIFEDTDVFNVTTEVDGLYFDTMTNIEMRRVTVEELTTTIVDTDYAGLYLYGTGYAVIEECEFSSFDNPGAMGGLYVAFGGNTTIRGCSFDDITGVAGALVVDDGIDVVVEDTTFNNCFATASGAGGLEIRSVVTSLDLNSLEFTGCNGQNTGGLKVNGGGDNDMFFDDLSFDTCHGVAGAGGFWLDTDVSLTLTNSDFTDCSSVNSAGCFYSADGSYSSVLVSVSDGTFTNCFSETATGAVRFEAPEDVTFTNVAFSGSNSTGGCAALHIDDASENIVLTDVSFEDGSSLDRYYGGVGEFFATGSINMTRVAVRDTYSGGYGAFYLRADEFHLESVVMSNIGCGNVGSDYAVFVYADNGPLTIRDSVFTGGHGLNVTGALPIGTDSYAGLSGIVSDSDEASFYNVEMTDNNIETLVKIGNNGATIIGGGFYDGTSIHDNMNGNVLLSGVTNFTTDGTVTVYNNNDDGYQVLCEMSDPCFNCTSCIGPGATCFLPGMDEGLYTANNNSCVCAEDVEGDACDSCVDDTLVFEGDFYDGECVVPGEDDDDGDEFADDDGADGMAPRVALTVAAMAVVSGLMLLL